MIQQRNERKSVKLPSGKVIGLIVCAALIMPQLFAGLLTVGLFMAPVMVPLFVYLRRKRHKMQHQSALENTSYTACAEEKAFEEKRVELFCRHDDKAVHHVVRGKEIDPWDRPDIDISKYQRKE